nr:hypothetical protein [uncultured Methanospirillum sp.]
MGQVTGMRDNSPASRSILYHAARELDHEGYHSVRIAGSSRPFDLIAWNGETILFIAVRRARSGGISRFSEDVSHLAELASGNTLPGLVYIWIFIFRQWYRYRIMPGGAIPVREGAPL